MGMSERPTLWSLYLRSYSLLHNLAKLWPQVPNESLWPLDNKLARSNCDTKIVKLRYSMYTWTETFWSKQLKRIFWLHKLTLICFSHNKTLSQYFPKIRCCRRVRTLTAVSFKCHGEYSKIRLRKCFLSWHGHAVLRGLGRTNICIWWA